MTTDWRTLNITITISVILSYTISVFDAIIINDKKNNFMMSVIGSE